jgi:uncharacterized membrane protein
MDLKGYRTIIFNVVTLVAALITMWTGTDVTGDVVEMTDAMYMVLSGLFVVFGIGNMWFRAITDTPIFNKEVTYHYAKKKQNK